MEYNELKSLYKSKKKKIIQRLNGFKGLWENGNDDEIFSELAFCIFTPQSKAKFCWKAVLELKEKDLLLKGTDKQIAKELQKVRFKNNKAKYVINTRNYFTTNGKFCVKPILNKFKDIYEFREWLVKNIKGIGYKEASHFLRNIGFGKDIAILDRHILRNLKEFGVIKHIPKALNRPAYLQIENKMKKFAKQIKIPLSHLDLLFWAKETGEIFK